MLGCNRRAGASRGRRKGSHRSAPGVSRRYTGRRRSPSTCQRGGRRSMIRSACRLTREPDDEQPTRLRDDGGPGPSSSSSRACPAPAAARPSTRSRTSATSASTTCRRLHPAARGPRRAAGQPHPAPRGRLRRARRTEFFDELLGELETLEDAASVPRPVPRGRRRDAAAPLQGDPPPPPAVRGRASPSSTASAPSARRSPRSAPGRRHHRHERPHARASCAPDPRPVPSPSRASTLAITRLVASASSTACRSTPTS